MQAVMGKLICQAMPLVTHEACHTSSLTIHSLILEPCQLYQKCLSQTPFTDSLFCMYLAHHELESKNFLVIIVAILFFLLLLLLLLLLVMQRYLMETHRGVTINAHTSCDKEAAS